MKQFPLLVFDWDGTLVDSIERIVTSLQHASRQVIKAEISKSRAKNVIGLGLMEAIAQLHPELDEKHQSGILENIANAYRRHYIYDNPVPAPLFSGVNDLLDELNHQGYILAISTGKSRSHLKQSIEEYDVARHFATTRCAGENRSKPHPEMLHEILGELNFSADEALMIGDSKYDLEMANNANMQCIGVTNGVHGADKLKKHNPLICLGHITELSDYLNHNQT